MEHFPSTVLDSEETALEAESSLDRVTSPEMKKLKNEVDNTVSKVEAVLNILRKRDDDRLVEYLSEDDLSDLDVVLTKLRDVDIYADVGFERTEDALGRLLGCLENIEMIQPRGEVREDLDSLKHLAWNIKELSDTCASLEFAASRVDEDGSRRVARLSNSIADVAHTKTAHIAWKIDELESHES